MNVKEISNELKNQLLKIEPSINWSMENRPCQVTLQNGETIDRVYMAEVATYKKTWGVMPDQDEGKSYILIEEVEQIVESPLTAG